MAAVQRERFDILLHTFIQLEHFSQCSKTPKKHTHTLTTNTQKIIKTALLLYTYSMFKYIGIFWLQHTSEYCTY